MRFYRNSGQPSKRIPMPSAIYRDMDAAMDSLGSLVGDEKPGPPDRAYSFVERVEAARALKFWRRFHPSALRQHIRDLPEEKRLEAFAGFMDAFNRYPTREELLAAGEMISRCGPKHGKGGVGRLFQLVGLISKYKSRIPRTFLDYFKAPLPVPEYKESDDDAQDLDTRPAGPFELLPRERYLPRMIKREMRARNALTRWQWMEELPRGAPEAPVVQFLIDASGSMEGPKTALALAAAMRLMEVQGVTPTIRFVADRISRVLQPEDAVPYACSPEECELGGGDQYGTALAAAEADSPDVRDFVVFSDFEIRQAFCTEWYQYVRQGKPPSPPPAPTHYVDEELATLTTPKRMHVVGIQLGGSDTPWWQNAHTRTDFSDLLTEE